MIYCNFGTAITFLNMQHISATPWQTCYYPIPKHFLTLHHRRCSTLNQCQYSLRAHLSNKSLFTPATTRSYSKDQDEEKLNLKNIPNPFEKDFTSFEDFRSPVQSSESQLEVYSEEPGISMWWAELKAAIGQRINVEGISCAVKILAKDRHLVLPHIYVPNIRCIDWSELKKRGFKGVVFDKDNTITVPYSLSLWPPLEPSIEECKSLFGNNIAVLSNSAGLYEYDRDGRKARALEKATGIKVITHKMKKPAGTAEDVERDFGCESSRLIMVGDRPFTDVVYGNRNGFLTILTEPLSVAEEPFIVRQVRKLELAIVRRWLRAGIKPISHPILPFPKECVKDQLHR